MMRRWIFSVARQWRKSSAPLQDFPYRVNPAAQARATAPLSLALQWRSKLGLPNTGKSTPAIFYRKERA